MSSLHRRPSTISRPRSGNPATTPNTDRPPTREAGDNPLPIPSRTSSLHSRITQPIPATLNIKVTQRTPKTLTHAYLVCGVGREPSQWVRAPPPTQGKITHMKGAVSQFWLPEILGSSPRVEQENDIAKALHGAMRACFPQDVEICTGRTQPHCVHHTFVLQQDSSQTLYGIALRVWSRADEKRAETIREMRKRVEGGDFFDAPDETYWIPYALSFLSRYPLFDLLGDYLRGMWIHWNKATNLFHADDNCREVSRILSFPAPRLNDLVRIDMKDYALCYQFPSSPTGFQNFSMWPLFSCLSIPNIVGVIEAALSPTRRIIFVSHYPAILTVAAETIRHCVRVYEWSGLYVPLVHARHAKDLVQEPGPYILGFTAESRSLFSAPNDALVVDLDRNFVLTSSPPSVWTPGQRTKMISRLTQALNGDVSPTGVPTHLRSAYAGGKLVPAGQIIVMRGEVESIQDPDWWRQDAVMSVFDHVCEKLTRNTGMKAIFGGAVKKPLMTKVSVRHLNEIIRERNQFSRDALEAWQDFINLKNRMDTELTKVTKRNNFLVEELDSWKAQFEKFQAFAAQLTKETNDLKAKIETHKRENRRLSSLIDQQKDETNRLTLRLSGTEKQRDEALEALVLQQAVAEELEKERKKNGKELAALHHTNANLLRQRDQAQRVVLQLRSLIDGQTTHLEHIVRSFGDNLELADVTEGEEEVEQAVGTPTTPVSNETPAPPIPSRAQSRASSFSSTAQQGEDVSPEMERRLFFNSPRGSRRYSEMSLNDVADRHIKEKTDAIADIIRSISEQCAAAVEGLQLAHRAAQEEQTLAINTIRQSVSEEELMGEAELVHGVGGHLHPNDSLSSVPSTPDLTYRSSTSLSMASTPGQDRFSLGNSVEVDVPTKIVEADDLDEIEEIEKHDITHEGLGIESQDGVEFTSLKKRKSARDIGIFGVESIPKTTDGIVNRAEARVSAFGANN
ncbi:hypothetical protein TWF225_012025 [Orbilia oligospora]|nr:hypothetical protein TWF751_002566 [Orbilia oligospora]KAF3167305.1 hypothetical protein TWF225_012025 [Orbilia oligospora]KAF3239999.1 hypothetical protein TWF217_001127 [Orbilia oligospora]KAF3269377.1 hypothetical protein TWF128_005622 [Orbilia oligospora]KAF3277191.1 hypothetical protein TWF132_001715 [Orbilia oligospora]